MHNDASGKLPGMGGVYNAVNLDVYCYAGNNPVKLVDPDGEALNVAIGAAIGFISSASIEIANHWHDTGNGTTANFIAATKATFTDSKSLAIIGTSTVIGAATSGLSAAVTTAKVTGTAAQIAKTVATNAAKNAVIGGSGAAVNHAIQAKIKGEKITADGVGNSFIGGVAFAGVLSVAGDCIKGVGIIRHYEVVRSVGIGANLRVESYSLPQSGISAALGSRVQDIGDIFKSSYEAIQIVNKKSGDKK